jgi:hypothetical protein
MNHHVKFQGLVAPNRPLLVATVTDNLLNLPETAIFSLNLRASHQPDVSTIETIYCRKQHLWRLDHIDIPNYLKVGLRSNVMICSSKD